MLSLVAADHRVRPVFTVAPSPGGADTFLREQGCSVLPWSCAVRREFDLVLASGTRELARLSGKRSLRAVAHESDLTASRGSGPEVVVGDLCYDRLLASIPFRAGYRRAFGVSRGQKLVVVTSPQGRGLVAGLPAERYRIVVAVAPDVWRPAVVAADLVIADNYGPVTIYGAAIGVPLMVTSPLVGGRRCRFGVPARATGAPRPAICPARSTRPCEAIVPGRTASPRG